ncbi:hypothetical protein NGUA39_04215 [Salmonella enterica]|nr:hypothetical protein NGUA39_04215 [Salmonella enterica]
MVRSARFQVRAQNIQRIEIAMHFRNHTINQRDKALAVFIRALDDFVVDIGNVAHIFQLIAEEAQITRNDIERNESTSVANMTEIVNGNTTHVHADFPGMNRFEFLFLARQCIKDF